MQIRKFEKINQDVSLLGFGMMRLPIFDGDFEKIDVEQTRAMLRYAIDNGVNYIDTAWVYHNGKSEEVTGQLLAEDGYRAKVNLATKNPSWLLNEADDWDKFLDQQLVKLQTNQIDFYLQHSLEKATYDRLVEWNFWDKAMKAKADGKIKYFGFSFHDSFEVFKEIVDAYDWDFCQIQLNYLDADYQAGLKGLEYARAKGLNVIVMEPLRGGQLVQTFAPEVQAHFDALPIKRSPVEWAFRWVANQAGVALMLSGMNNLDQIKENVAIMSQDDMLVDNLSEAENQAIDEMANYWKSLNQVPCTKCKYCIPECPQGIDIPACLAAYNYANSPKVDARRKARTDYLALEAEGKGPSKCVACGVCMKACPQHIEIPKRLKLFHNIFKN